MMERRTLTIVASWALGIAALSCTNSGRIPNDSPPTEAPLAVVSGQLAESFDSLSELSAAAKMIAVIRVEESETAMHERVPFSILHVTVEESIFGGTDAKSIVVVETGGVVEGATGDAHIDVAFEGIRVMKPGERWLVFLAPASPAGPVADGAYVVLGIYQGKLRVSGDSRLEFTGSTELLSGPEMQGARELIGKSTDEAKTVIGQTRSR